MTSRCTMDDVAALAGVSRASVSRAFLGQKKVSHETRQRILEAAAQLGYVPNIMASRLAAGGNAETVGLLLRDASNPAYGLLFTRLAQAAREQALPLVSMTIDADDHGRRQVQALHTLVGMQVGGLIVATGGVTSAQLEPFRSRLPILRAGRPESTPLIHAVSYDEVDGARQLADYVVAQGHRDILVFVTEQDESYPEWVRGHSMLKRLGALGVVPTPVLVRGPADGCARAVELAGSRRVSVVMCPSDRRAFEVLRAARSAGLDVPTQLSVTGCDGISPGLDLLGLSTFRIGVEELARRSVQRMAGLLAGAVHDTVRDLVGGELVPGSTVATIDPKEWALVPTH